MRLGEYEVGLPLRRLPVPLLFAVAGLVTLGTIFVTSAAGPGRTGLAARQLLWVGMGLAAFLLVFLFDFRIYVRGAYFAYAAALLALAAVLFTSPVKGARSWFDLGFMKLQPSEFAKLALILALTRFLAARPQPLRLRDLAGALALVGLPVAFILKQPDLGTAMVFVPLGAMAVYAAGARARHLIALGVGGLGGLLVLWQFVMNPIQKARVYAWLDPEPYKLEQAYQLTQSLVAVGSGGAFGKGLGCGTQNQFNLLPLKESDFIFSVIAEEGGFLAAAGVLVLTAFLAFMGAAVAIRACDREGQIAAATVTAVLGSQALINVAVTIGLLPTTGITLPFVSYGGSSMVTTFAAVGLLANISARPRPPGLFG